MPIPASCYSEPDDPAYMKREFELIETFQYDPDSGFIRLDRHMARLRKSAETFNFPLNESALHRKLEAIKVSSSALRIRLTLDPNGIINLTSSPYIPLAPSTQWRLSIATTRLDSCDPLLQHKTSRRQIYDEARSEFSPNEIDEVLLLNERGEVCEGTITSIFVDIGETACLTPALECGLLAGVLREEMLDRGIARETVITMEQLKAAQSIFVGNSLRGMICAHLTHS